MELIKHLLFNLALLLVIMFVFKLWADRYYPVPFPPTLSFLGFFLSILICLWFSIPQQGIMVDLRQIPIVIGGLYYGYGPLLGFFAIVLRGLFYGFNSGWWAGLPIYVVVAIFLWIIHPWFLRQSAKKRFHVSLSTISIISLLSSLGTITLDYTNYEAWFILIIIQAIGICMMSYLLEAMMQNDFLRDQMVKAQKIELASHMSAAISHEVRNPLTAAQGFLQLASEDKNVQGETMGYIEIALNELKAAEQVIQDYFTFAHPSMKAVEKLCVIQELERVYKPLQPLANMNSVKIITENNGLSCILGDRGLFRQCFLNILKNSLESMPTGGTLNIHTSNSNKKVQIFIRDTGIGMSAEQVKRLGEPYYTTKGKSGTGLGLMVSFSIIRTFKGTVKVDSVPGKGTEFVVTFPEHNLSY